MSKPVTVVLKPSTTSPTTVQAAATQHNQSTAALSNVGNSAVAISVPMIASGAAMAAIPTVRQSVTIINPTDGKLVYIGQDGTVNAAGGHALYPGNQLTISGYSGNIWTLSSDGPATLFYTST